MGSQAQAARTTATDPKPDHGDHSYVGTHRHAGRRALITGGDSGIGRAVAFAATSVLPASDDGSYISGAVVPVTGGKHF